MRGGEKMVQMEMETMRINKVIVDRIRVIYDEVKKTRKSVTFNEVLTAVLDSANNEQVRVKLLAVTKNIVETAPQSEAVNQ